MKIFKVNAAQGEITIRRIGNLPSNVKGRAGFTPLKPEHGVLIVGHSETGHHHVLSRDDADVLVMDKPPEGLRVLLALVNTATPLTHQRSYDTHAPIMLEPGEYELRIAREYDPYQELARQVAD